MLPLTVPGKASAWLALAVIAGPAGALTLRLLSDMGVMPMTSNVSLWAAVLMIMVAPVLEELAFRGAVMDFFRETLRRLGVADTGSNTCANAMTSIAFAACHLPYQSAPMAFAILLPSLLRGRMPEVTRSVVPCMLLHAWFNACFVSMIINSTLHL